MNDYSFYSAILGLSSNWRILDVTVNEQSGDIELHIRSRKGSRFSCPVCGAFKLPSGKIKARWLHENHLKIRFYISAFIPVITCEQCGEMKADIPWEQSGALCEELVHVNPPGEDEEKPLLLF
jgi:transposase